MAWPPLVVGIHLPPVPKIQQWQEQDSFLLNTCCGPNFVTANSTVWGSQSKHNITVFSSVLSYRKFADEFLINIRIRGIGLWVPQQIPLSHCPPLRWRIQVAQTIQVAQARDTKPFLGKGLNCQTVLLQGTTIKLSHIFSKHMLCQRRILQ